MVINRIGPERLLGYQAAVFFTAVIAAILVAVITMHSPRAAMELKAEDAVQRVAPQAVRSDVVILALDDASVARYGAVRSWPRSLLARGLDAIERGNPKAVVMDVALDKRTRTGDTALWRSIANNRNVVLGMAYDANRGNTFSPDDIRSLVFLEKFALAGNITYDPTQVPNFVYYLFDPPMSDFSGSSAGVGVFVRETDSDAVVRTARMAYLTHVEYPQSTGPLPSNFGQAHLADGAPVALPNITLEAALRAFQMDKDNVSVKTGDSLNFLGDVDPPVNIPIDTQGRMNIRYAGGPGTYKRVSFVDVIDGKVDPSVFKDKLVLVGATSLKDPATDARSTPFRGLMPRVEITANAVATVLNRSYYGRYENRTPGILIILGLIVGLTMMFVSGARAAALGIGLLIAYIIATVVLYAYGTVMLPLLPGIAVILLTLLVALALYAGPYRPVELEASPTYVPPSPEAVRH